MRKVFYSKPILKLIENIFYTRQISYVDGGRFVCGWYANMLSCGEINDFYCHASYEYAKVPNPPLGLGAHLLSL
jgi:hypothetical protein